MLLNQKKNLSVEKKDIRKNAMMIAQMMKRILMTNARMMKWNVIIIKSVEGEK